MIFYIAFLLLSLQRIISEYCPKSEEFILSLDKKCFKLYDGKIGFENISQSCNNNQGLLSGFINNSETRAVLQLLENHYKDLNATYIDRGFTCRSKKDPCLMNRDKNEGILNNITYLTDKFPCRGVMKIRDLTFFCIDMAIKTDIVYACQKNPLYIKNCTSYNGYDKYIDGNCYKLLEKIDFTKQTAEIMCKDNSGTLPIIRNDFENLAVDELLDKHKFQFWLDFSCLTKNVSSCRWSTNNKIIYKKLEKLNDDNLCGYIKNSSTWDTDHCDKKKKVICQIRNE
uniref:C-type lectin domain-containing protein n=1 Tax=Strongyloides venezuelensis TaxID=75913 RepID=A0A0K0FN22_STRVS